jgi:RNA polymerase sigma factor (sigma-70 family)
MPNTVLSAFVARVRRAALKSDPDLAPTDGRLLGRFVISRDEQAFAALVDRHGPMVLAVCRRVAGDPHLADDAFQAAFLVLARRAAVVKPREAVRAWLYGVAVRTAREARAVAARRRSREVPVPNVPDRPAPAETPADAGDLRALDEEIARLPDRLRAAVVLCELDGIGRKEAAARLGVPEGTLSSRLAKARKLLAVRLRGRGVVLPAAGLAALFGRAASAAAVRAALADAAVRLAGPGPVSAAVAKLSRGVFRTMLLNKLKLVSLGLIATAVVGGSSAVGLLRHAEAQDPPAKPAAARPDAPKPAGPGRIVFEQGGSFTAADPDGANERRIELPPGEGTAAVLSPDGRSLAYWTQHGDDLNRVSLYVRDLGGKAAIGFDLPHQFKEGQGFIMFCWSPDGSQLHVNLGTPGTKGVTHLRVDLKAKKVTTLDVLKTHLVNEWSCDGKYLVTTRVGDGDEWDPKGVYLMNPDGTEHRMLTDAAIHGRLSPDGKRLLCTDHNSRLFVLEVGKPGSLTAVEGVPEKLQVTEFAWSPDGRRIAYTTGVFQQPDPGDLEKIESRLVVADPDGKNAKVLRSAKGEFIRLAGWR